MAFTLRAATADDREPVLDLLEELFDPPGTRPPGYTRARGEEGFALAVASPEADVLLAVDGRTLVGLASVYLDYVSMRFGPRCWLADLVVTRGQRSGGVGALLLAAAVDWARQRGCTHLELASAHGRTGAHRFYLARGMRDDSRLFGLAVD